MRARSQSTHTDRTPPPKGYTLPMGLFAAATAGRHDALAAATARAPHTPTCARFVVITPPQPSDQHSSVLAAAPYLKRAHTVHAPPTDVWPLRVPPICDTCMLAAATACNSHVRGLSAATEQPGGVARYNPHAAPPSVGLTRP